MYIQMHSKPSSKTSRTTFAKFNIEFFKGKGRQKWQKCHLCQGGCKPEHIDKHYRNHHRAHRWCQAEKHPGNPTFESNRCRKLCLICDAGTYFDNHQQFRQHLVKFHRIHTNCVEFYLIEKPKTQKRSLGNVWGLVSAQASSNIPSFMSSSCVISRFIREVCGYGCAPSLPVFNLPYYGSLQRQLLWNEGEILYTSYVKMLCYENKFPLLFIVMFRDCMRCVIGGWMSQ